MDAVQKPARRLAPVERPRSGRPHHKIQSTTSSEYVSAFPMIALNSLADGRDEAARLNVAAVPTSSQTQFRGLKRRSCMMGKERPIWQERPGSLLPIRSTGQRDLLHLETGLHVCFSRLRLLFLQTSDINIHRPLQTTLLWPTLPFNLQPISPIISTKTRIPRLASRVSSSQQEEYAA